MIEQDIRYCTASDGVRIAYATAGSGPPLVKAANWLGHLEFEWRSPIWRHWLEAFTADHLVVRYDERGNGLSDWDVADCSFDAWVNDLETVVDALGLEQFALFGWSQGVAVSIAYAVRHPDRVNKMILFGGFAGGRQLSAEQQAEIDAIVTLTRAGWGRDDSSSRQIFAARMLPDATPEQARWLDDLARISVSPENAVRYLEEFVRMDVLDLLPQVRAPTLVMHARGDRGVTFDNARELAAAIPGARLVPLDSRNHLLMEADAAWPVFVAEARRFLGDAERAPATAAKRSDGAGPLLSTILFTDIVESTALTERMGDAGAHELVRVHNEVVRHALGLHGGTEIKHTGDGIMASFGSASRALECAAEIQTAIAAREAGAHPLRVRVGVNAGEPIAEDGDLFGTTVQLARRICDRAEPGEALVSNVVRELAAGKGFLFADAGVSALKGFDEPVRLFALRWRDGD